MYGDVCWSAWAVTCDDGTSDDCDSFVATVVKYWSSDVDGVSLSESDAVGSD